MMKLQDANKINISQLPDVPLVHQLDSHKKTLTTKSILAISLIVFSGILTGFLLSIGVNKHSISSNEVSQTKTGQEKLIVGSSDTKTFRDSAQGDLETGGINGEGTHRLIRPGGDSQTVYLTSSVLDLNQFVGKNVKVWGETFSAKKAGWLMDVGKIEVL